MRRGPSVKNSFSYSFSGRKAAAMVVAVSVAVEARRPSAQHGQLRVQWIENQVAALR